MTKPPAMLPCLDFIAMEVLRRIAFKDGALGGRVVVMVQCPELEAEVRMWRKDSARDLEVVLQVSKAQLNDRLSKVGGPLADEAMRQLQLNRS